MMPYRSFPLADIQRQFGPQPLLDEVLFNYMDFHVYERLLPELGFEVASNLNSDEVHEGTHFALNVHFQHYTLTSSLVSNQVSINWTTTRTCSAMNRCGIWRIATGRCSGDGER